MSSYLVVIALLWSGGLAYLQFGLRSQLEEQLADGLFRNARLSLDTLKASGVGKAQDPTKALRKAARTIGGALGLRATIIASDGRVLGDSELSDAQIAGIENHASRPEVVSARRDGIGKIIRRSETIGSALLYLALPIKEEPVKGGVIRLAMRISDVKSVADKMRKLLYIAGGAALVLALLVSFGAGKIADRVFQQLNDSVDAVTRGNFSFRTRSTRADEVGEFSRAMDRLLGEVEERLEDLRRERDRFGAILHGMSEGVMVTDAEGRIALVNAALRNIFPALPLIREDIPTPLETLRAVQVEEAVSDALSGEDAVLEREVEVSGPPGKTLVLHAAKFGDENRPRLIVVFHDVTHIRQLETVRRDFTTNVSHELRTPLTAIRAAAETLQTSAQADPDAVVRFASTIARHCHRLEALVEDLLELGRIESKQEHIRLETTSLGTPVQAAQRVLEPLFEEKRVKLRVEVSPDNEEVWGDPSAIERIFINLLENAVNHSPPESEITISAHVADDEWVEVKVVDQGEGIEPEHLSRVFERFYRVDASRSRDRGGTGLGLAIAKHLVQGMGGEIRVESTPGRGSIFELKLQRMPADSLRLTGPAGEE